MGFDKTTRGMLLVTLAIALAPLLLQLPLGLSLGMSATAILVILASERHALSGWLRLFVALSAVIVVLLLFDLRLGRDTGSGLLVAMLAIKPAETRSIRDARSLVGFALFAPFAAFLLDQGPLSLVLGLLAVVSGLLTLQRLADVESHIESFTIRAGLRGIGQLLLLGLPFTLAAFWLFPRIPTPLWGVPDRAKAVVGLSDSMAPGDWFDLLIDDSPALRIRFDGPAPPRSQMYWRGPVLWDFDGRKWSSPGRTESVTRPNASTGNTQWRYQLEIEPSERRYITALDLPLSAPTESMLTNDGNLLAVQRLQGVTRWNLVSAPPAVFEATLGVSELKRALAIPADYNPRAQALARRWRDETGRDTAAIIDRATAMVNAEFSYSLSPPPLGRDSIDEFLFVTKTGFCEHFSSAFVFLMRSAGVPARVVTGYAGGYLNPVGDYWIVRNSDAHAWAEVWQADRGWVRIDPTAAVASERIFDTVADRMPGRIGNFDGFSSVWNTTDWLRRGWNDFVLGFNADRQSRMLRKLGIDRLGAGTLALLFAVVALAALGWMLWWLRRGERESDPLLRAWHRISRQYARLGLARNVEEPAAEWAARIARSRPGDSVMITSVATKFVQARYGAESWSKSDIRELIVAMRRARPR